MKIVIIEDEILTAEDLQDDLLSLKMGIEIMAVLPTVKEAINYFSNHHDYDLIFSDIQLGDGQSFEIFKKIPINAPIIFCTAYDQYALEAFKTNGIDYILKPFDKKSISQSLSKYHLLKEKMSSPLTELQNFLSNYSHPIVKIQSIIVQKADKLIPIQVTDIAVLQLENKLIYIHTFDGTRHFISQSLDDFEVKMSPQFYRLNRQFLVNRKAIKDVSQYFGRKLSVKLIIPFSETLIISKGKASHFLNWLAEN